MSHLFFANDAPLLCYKASLKNVWVIKEILSQYEVTSSQKVNFEKSVVFYNRNIPTETRIEVCRKLEIMKEATSGKYLGLPMVIGKIKNQVFGYVKSSINSKLQCWKNRLLGLAGKKILIKICLDSPTQLYHVLFQVTKRIMQADLQENCIILVEWKWLGEENALGKMEQTDGYKRRRRNGIQRVGTFQYNSSSQIAVETYKPS